jgi:hypothetical protein
MKETSMRTHHLSITMLLAVPLASFAFSGCISGDQRSSGGEPLMVPSDTGGTGGSSAGGPGYDAATLPGAQTDVQGSVGRDAAPQPGSDLATPPLLQPLDDWCKIDDERFSFFVTSMDAIWKLSGSTPGDMSGGFGGNFGGIAGADKICQTIGEATGHGHKNWRALLSATNDGNGNPVHAIERIGEGPWYDANDRQVATGRAGLLSGDRPNGDAQTINDLPDECGVPITALGDAHDVITGSNKQGRLNSTDLATTCNDWTSSDSKLGGGGGSAPPPPPGGGGGGGRGGQVMCGHSFPRGMAGGPGGGRGGGHWLSDHGVPGCGKGALIVQGFGEGCIGCTGGYGALYCFALTQ